ncbi:hypothetical protein EON65_39610 [archaeon]|nr:MAG: hypothetical protein EON65_39610 [archaeon]
MHLLLIECIHVKDAVDRGSVIDPQSPAVFFFLGSEAFKTRRYNSSYLARNLFNYHFSNIWLEFAMLALMQALPRLLKSK